MVQSSTRWHRFVDHVGELELEVAAEDLGALLAEAARALGEILRRGAAQPESGDEEREIDVRSLDREALLVDWLNELLFLAETELWVPCELEILEVADDHVKARARGARLDQASTLVKAATHHRVRVENVDGGLRAGVVLDV